MSTLQRRSQRGATLIEVMVSVIVLVLGLLGLAQLQAKTLVMGQSAHYRSIAADLAADLADRIRANRTPFLVDPSAEVVPALPPDFGDCVISDADAFAYDCTQTTDPTRQEYLAAAEMQEWHKTLDAQLPGATFSIDTEEAAAAGHLRYLLTITWNDNRAASASSSTSSGGASSSTSSGGTSSSTSSGGTSSSTSSGGTSSGGSSTSSGGSTATGSATYSTVIE